MVEVAREFSMIFGKEYKHSEMKKWLLPVSFLVFALVMIILNQMQQP